MLGESSQDKAGSVTAVSDLSDEAASLIFGGPSTGNPTGTSRRPSRIH